MKTPTDSTIMCDHNRKIPALYPGFLTPNPICADMQRDFFAWKEEEESSATLVTKGRQGGSKTPRQKTTKTPVVSRLSFFERCRVVSNCWAHEGYGVPVAVGAFYVIKMFAFFWFFVRFIYVPLGGGSDYYHSIFWGSASQEIRVEALFRFAPWAILIEALGFGAACGPLVGKYNPYYTAYRHFLRPGTMKRPSLPFLNPKDTPAWVHRLFGGYTRTYLDVGMFVALVAACLHLLWPGGVVASGMILGGATNTTTSSVVVSVHNTLLFLILILIYFGFSDKSVYIAARVDYYMPILATWYACVCSGWTPAVGTTATASPSPVASAASSNNKTVVTTTDTNSSSGSSSNVVISLAILGLQTMQLSIWLGAALSKAGPWFSYVTSVMLSNSFSMRVKWIRMLFYRSIPVLTDTKSQEADEKRKAAQTIHASGGSSISYYYYSPNQALLPSALCHIVTLFGTITEFGFPMLLAVSYPGTLLRQGARFLCLAFHGYIVSQVPVATPTEWNVYVVVLTMLVFSDDSPAFLDGAQTYFLPSFSSVAATTSVSLCLGAFLFIVGIVIPVVGNIWPRKVGFLCAYRYYAGNWPYNLYMIRKQGKSKRNKSVAGSSAVAVPLAAAPLPLELVSLVNSSSAGMVHQVLSQWYTDNVVWSLLYRPLAFRMMHRPGLVLPQMISLAMVEAAQPAVDSSEHSSGDWILRSEKDRDSGSAKLLKQEALLSGIREDVQYAANRNAGKSYSSSSPPVTITDTWDQYICNDGELIASLCCGHAFGDGYQSDHHLLEAIQERGGNQGEGRSGPGGCASSFPFDDGDIIVIEVDAASISSPDVLTFSIWTTTRDRSEPLAAKGVKCLFASSGSGVNLKDAERIIEEWQGKGSSGSDAGQLESELAKLLFS